VLGEPEKALKRYERALEISGHSTRYRNNYANLLTRMGRYREAIPHYEKLLAVDPSNLLPYYGLANVNRLLGRWGRAREVQAGLVRLIAEGRLRNLPRNGGVWYFQTVPAHAQLRQDLEKPPLAHLVTIGQKEVYARLGLALTQAAARHEGRARRQLRQARAIDLDPTKIAAPLEIICFDVDQLARQPRLRLTSRADDFVAALEQQLERRGVCH
jgi:tetratricopeptide (TPR) repeat protein